MKKKYPIRQEIKALSDRKPNRLTFTPPAKQQVAFFVAVEIAGIKKEVAGRWHIFTLRMNKNIVQIRLIS